MYHYLGISKRIFVIANEQSTITPPLKPHAFINPVISVDADTLTAERIHTLEGCLSIPDLRAMVPRYSKVLVTGYEMLNHGGKRVTMIAQGYVAIMVQHEYDHLNGILFVDKMETSTLTLQSQVERFNYTRGVRDGSWRMVN